MFSRSAACSTTNNSNLPARPLFPFSLCPPRSRDTFDENMQNGLFGLTQQSWSFVKNITPGMPLFLYNLSERLFYGVFEAVSWEAYPPPGVDGISRPLHNIG